MLKGIEKGVAIAINQSAIVNRPETFEKMRSIGPKVCITMTKGCSLISPRCPRITGYSCR